MYKIIFLIGAALTTGLFFVLSLTEPKDLKTTDKTANIFLESEKVEVSPTFTPLPQTTKSPLIQTSTLTPTPTPTFTKTPTSTPIKTQASTPTPSPIIISGNGSTSGNVGIGKPAPTPSPTPTSTSTPTPTPIPTPTPTPQPLLPVVINEIAWMGTQAEETDEWLELYNPNNITIDLNGWTLKSLTGTSPDPNITLTGEISALGYYLLERTDDNTISDISADKIYTGALNNTGEILELKNNNGNLQNRVDSWQGGSNQKIEGIWQRFSMERINPLQESSASNWGTNNGVIKNGRDVAGYYINGTPRAKNSVSL